MVLIKASIYSKRMKSNIHFTPSTKISSKSMRGLNIRPEITKQLEENIGGKLFDIGLENDFSGFDTQRKSNKS